MHHHIVLDRDILEELLTEVERAHAQEFWGAFIHAVDVTKWNAASEYILYYHYALWRHPERVESRHLTACDIICDADDRFDAQAAMTSLCDGGAYQVVGCHDFLDLRERLQTMDYIPDALKRVLAGSSAPALLLFLRDGALRLEEYSSPSAPPQTMR